MKREIFSCILVFILCGVLPLDLEHLLQKTMSMGDGFYTSFWCEYYLTSFWRLTFVAKLAGGSLSSPDEVCQGLRPTYKVVKPWNYIVT